MKTYIEVKTYESEECVKRIDVTGKSERSIDRIESGMNRNMNHKDYYTVQVETEKELETF